LYVGLFYWELEVLYYSGIVASYWRLQRHRRIQKLKMENVTSAAASS